MSKVQVLTIQETHRDDVIAMVDVKPNESLVGSTEPLSRLILG